MVIADRNEIVKMQQNVVFVKIYDRKLTYLYRINLFLLYVVFTRDVKIKWRTQEVWRSGAFC